jgi:hypothetical protein
MLIARQGVVGGVLTQNQALSLYDPNLPMQPDGDRLLAPTNLAASGSQAAGGAPDDAGRPQAEDQRL